jgi:hypothetical protein
MNREEVIKLMESSQTEQEWNDNCTKVKTACGGYPDFWFAAIVSSGLVSRVAARFGKDDKIHVTVIQGEQ